MSGHLPRMGRVTAVLTSLSGLAGCDPALVPVVAPPVPVVAQVPVQTLPETAGSAAIRAYYGQVQASLLSQGLLRTDDGAVDAPFTDRNLTDNFLRIALYEEYSHGVVTNVRSETATPLARWSVPVRVALRFGASVPADKRATDTARVASYLARLARVTGHQILLDDSRPNYWIHIASIDERAALGPTVAAELPGLTPGQISSITAMDKDTYCQVLTEADPVSSTYSRAVVVIPSEHPDLLRLACIHEEIAQSLGLPNDSNAARPSIFNDDQEFALLTRQDELMLRILYDPALRPGMTETEARPIVEMLASRLLSGES